MGKRFRDRALVVAAAVAAIAAGYFAYSLVPAASAVQLTATKFQDLRGNSGNIGEWHGKVRVVNFWATWCAPCREEIPAFVLLQQKYADKGVVFIGIALDDRQKVAQFAAETGMNYPVFVAEFDAIELSRSAGNRLQALPFTVLLERDGDVAHAFSGVVKEEQLELQLRRVL